MELRYKVDQGVFKAQLNGSIFIEDQENTASQEIPGSGALDITVLPIEGKIRFEYEIPDLGIRVKKILTQDRAWGMSHEV